MSSTNKKRPAAAQRERAEKRIDEPTDKLHHGRNGKQRSAKPSAGKTDKEKEDRSTADKIVELAFSRYRIGRSDTDDPFAVKEGGANIALMLRGSKDALRSALSRDHRRAYGKVPSSPALTDALTTLQGEALEKEAEPIYLRVAEHDGKIVIDLGDASGRAVVVSAGTWEVVDRSPVLFRRTAATGDLPMPERGGDLQVLRDLLNVTDETWPLVRGWLVAALLPNMPHPILLLGGEQGAGKTTAAKALIGLFDPSPAPVRTQPREAKQWVISASASWGVCIDNVSYIPDWLSDALCKAVTGDGWLDRKLYTDGDLFVLSFRRVISLTSIDAGALRGDLGDRVLLVDLETILESKRLTESELDARYKKARPQLFGALLDLLAEVLKELPHVELDCSPRMADFGRLLAAMDKVIGGQALEIYMGQRDRIAETVIDSDPVALAIRELIDPERTWEGTADELLKRITPSFPGPPKGWPRTPHVLGGRLKRLAPALKQIGIELSYPPRSGSRRLLRLARTVCDGVTGDDNADGPSVTPESGDSSEKNGVCDRNDRNDNDLQPLSDDDLDESTEQDGESLFEPHDDELAKLGF